MRVIAIISTVLLAGFGVYYALVIPALSARWTTLPIGIVLLAAAAVLPIVALRRRAVDRRARKQAEQQSSS